jgi:hypothetical protein
MMANLKLAQQKFLFILIFSFFFYYSPFIFLEFHCISNFILFYFIFYFLFWESHWWERSSMVWFFSYKLVGNIDWFRVDFFNLINFYFLSNFGVDKWFIKILWYLIGIFNENILKNIFLSHKSSTFDFPTITMIDNSRQCLDTISHLPLQITYHPLRKKKKHRSQHWRKKEVRV